MRIILQTESGECGLACLAMVADHHGLKLDLSALRRRFSFGAKGATLVQLISNASQLGLTARAVKLDVEQIAQLRVPCILHWNLNHFVVLRKVRQSFGGKVVVELLDPAIGRRRLSLAEFSDYFTGVALELAPGEDFIRRDETFRMPLSALTGKIFGLKAAIAQLIVLAFALELLVLVMPLFNQMVIDEAITSGDLDLMTVLVIGFGLVVLVQTLLDLARSWFLMRWSMEVNLQWSARIFRHLIRLPVSFFEKRHLGDIVSKFGSMEAIQSTLTTIFVQTLLDGLMSVFALAMMWIYSPALSLIVLAAVGAYVIARVCFYRPLQEASRERLILSAKENSNFLETIRAITPLKLFGREAERQSQWQNLKQDVANRDIRTQKLTLAFRLLTSFIASAQTLLLFYLGGRMVIQQSLTLGMLTAFASYGSTFTTRILSLVDAAVNFRMLSLHTERLSDIVGTATEPDEGSIDQVSQGFQPSIALRNVKFRYSDSEPWILNGVDLDIQPSDRVALIGPSGSGKSTLAKILIGLLQPTEGEILVGGIPLAQLGLKNFRSAVGTVMQNDVLLGGSIADNIAFFDVAMNFERVESAAKLAQIHDDVLKMPMGYQTLVGDMGSNLSGGQKQRVLLARALYREPIILALDEATSHLDVETEQLITKALEAIPLTQVIVAHRPQAISAANRVIYVGNGKVSERSIVAAETAYIA
ncbi:peptidase domain-containing ABC transporter [Duganella radicis]|uniref:Cyclolysin secretion/processing ATP-binding protein CyaB n=1 Tax=Duganella radicis TaxID=551988 RepID=A0A6L6PQM4_9BURK|nr:peptidase domain-containing ABC transporter [Duganella radicis]MTV41154.1 ATP-binding cassette domain-containing protein [Duganella radicis]